ncbi:MAG TPA: transcription termination factor Rho [Acidimicrobiales bacterium]|nr:transcription termination factor Rho [Acidimicrobiales bacterium]
MSGEQQLERSVLEGKEREELHAIADAIGLKPASRTKKADLVTQILKATGVEVEANGAGSGGNGGGSAGDSAVAEKPKRARRTTKAAAATTSADADTETPASPESPVETPSSNGAGELAAPPTPVGELAAPPAPVVPPEAEAAPGESKGGDQKAGDQKAGDQKAGGQPPEQREPREQQQRQQQESRQDRHDRQNQQQSQQQSQQHQRQFDGGQAEPGNRRNRRRRGRDRDRGPGGGGAIERDLQGSGQEQAYQGEPVPVSGLLDLRDEGFGFLRTNGYLAGPKDVYVSISQVRRFALRKGDYVEGASRPAGSNEKYPALLRIDTVSGMTPDEARLRPRFEDLTPLFPDQKLALETPGDPSNMTARIVDLISPIGRGQRGLIVSPPKAGKTTVMKQIAHSIEANNPEVHLMVLLVDERPEEVTDMRRSVKGEVVASTFDRPSDEHTSVAELTIERAKRMVEMGTDVVIILDGITRLARAYNLAAPATGRIMSGGIDTGALYPPKKFFGAARNVEEGGSLTILATALVETGSRMDEVIFEEFKGTGNMELRLDRRLSEKRIYPAIDVNASSTRHEELLFERGQLQQVWKLRRVLNALAADGNAAPGLELLIDKIKTTKSNDEFLAEIAKGATPPV